MLGQAVVYILTATRGHRIHTQRDMASVLEQGKQKVLHHQDWGAKGSANIKEPAEESGEKNSTYRLMKERRRKKAQPDKKIERLGKGKQRKRRTESESK